MVLATTPEGMRKALGALRIERDPSITVADFSLKYQEIDRSHIGGRLSSSPIRESWADFGVNPGDQVTWVVDYTKNRLTIRVTLREEAAAPSLVDLMAG